MSERFIDMDLGDLRAALNEASDEAEKEIITEAIIEMAATLREVCNQMRTMMRNIETCTEALVQMNRSMRGPYDSPQETIYPTGSKRWIQKNYNKYYTDQQTQIYSQGI